MSQGNIENTLRPPDADPILGGGAPYGSPF